MTSLKSHEAIKRLVRDRARVFGQRLGLSGSAVYKWTEESHHTQDPACIHPSGNRNPLDVIEQMIEIGVAHGDRRENYLAPVEYLEERFGRIGVNLPTVMPKASDILRELAKTIKEFGELVEATSEALKTDGVDRRENERIQREGWQLVRQTTTLMKLAEMQSGGASRHAR